MVDSDYVKPTSPETSTDTPKPENTDHSSDNDSKGCAGKDGFFKNAFGKIKDRLSSDEEDNDKAPKKKD